MKDLLEIAENPDKGKQVLKQSKDTTITSHSGQDYSAIEVSHPSESNDPRVGGTKITFDSRLDKISDGEKTSELEAYIKVK